jgi:hypothetical protein
MVGRRLGGLAGLRGVTAVSGWGYGAASDGGIGNCELLALPAPASASSGRAVATGGAVARSIMDRMLIANKFADIGGNTMISLERAAYPSG